MIQSTHTDGKSLFGHFNSLFKLLSGGIVHLLRILHEEVVDKEWQTFFQQGRLGLAEAYEESLHGSFRRVHKETYKNRKNSLADFFLLQLLMYQMNTKQNLP